MRRLNMLFLILGLIFCFDAMADRYSDVTCHANNDYKVVLRNGRDTESPLEGFSYAGFSRIEVHQKIAGRWQKIGEASAMDFEAYDIHVGRTYRVRATNAQGDVVLRAQSHSGKAFTKDDVILHEFNVVRTVEGRATPGVLYGLKFDCLVDKPIGSCTALVK
jgi:hypothetical protein